MKKRARISTTQLLILLSCGLLVLAHRSIAAGKAEVEYEVSLDPEREVLFLGFYGGGTRFGVQYRLYGDGRLVHEVVNEANGQVHQSDQVRLEVIDFNALFEGLVRSGLAELTPDRLAEYRAEYRGVKRFSVTDGGSARFILRLERFRGSSGRVQSSFEQDLWVKAPRLQERFFPEVRELSELNNLSRALASYFSDPASERRGRW